MSILLFAVIVIIVVAMLVYAVDLVPLVGQFSGLLKVLIILIGALLILNRAGVV